MPKKATLRLGLTHPLTFALKCVPINVWCMKASFNVVNAVAAPAFKVYEFAQGHRSSQEKIVTAQSHNLTPQSATVLANSKQKMKQWWEVLRRKRLGFEKKPACVWVEGGGGYKLAAKLCHKASQSPPAAKPLLTRLSNFRPSFRPARLSMAIPKNHFSSKRSELLRTCCILTLCMRAAPKHQSCIF